MEKQFCFDYEHYAALSELSEADRRLVAEAERATANAHAPYSKFRVGAAARLRSGRILCGSNFEAKVCCLQRNSPGVPLQKALSHAKLFSCLVHSALKHIRFPCVHALTLY